ncbi:uncharacterized protein LOC144923682 isoform X1 [Branchiostoma floridae x Branchiostoma belcheri]
MASSSLLNPTVCEVSYDDEIGAGGREVVAAYQRPRTGGLSPPRARPQVLRDTPSLSYGDYEEYREYVKCIYRDSRPVSQLTYAYSPRNTPSTPFIGNPQTVLHQPDARELGTSRRDRVHTAPCSATRRVPTARTMPGAVRSSPAVSHRVPTSHNINAETFRRPQWIPALNAWVPDTKQREKESAYINFVGAVSLLDRGIYHEEPNLNGLEPPQPCPRFMNHMTQSVPIGPVNAAKSVKRITSNRSPTIPKTPFTDRRREDLLPKSLTRPPQRFVRQRVPHYDDRQEVNAEDVLLSVPRSPPPSVQDSEAARDDGLEEGHGSFMSHSDTLHRREELADVDSLGLTAGDPEDDGIFSMFSGYHGDMVKRGSSGGAGAGAGVSSGGSDSGGSEEEEGELQVSAGAEAGGAGGGMGVTSLGGSVKGLELLHAILKDLLGSTPVEDIDTEVLKTTLNSHLEDCNTCTHLVRQVVRRQLGPVPDNYLMSGLISILPLLSAGGSARSQLSLPSDHDDWSQEGEMSGRERRGMEEEETEEGVSLSGGGHGGTDETNGEGETCGEGTVQETAGEVQDLKEEETLKDSAAKSKKDRKERRRSSTISEATEDKAPKSIMKKTKTQPRRVSAPRVTIETDQQSSMSQQTDTEVNTAVEDYPIEEELESVSEVSTIEVPQPKFILDNKGKKKGRDLKSDHACRQKSPKVSAVISLRSPKPRDTTLQDELRRQQLAEERRAKAAQMFEKLRKKPTDRGDEMEEGERDRALQQDFKDYGFLSKYCIFNKDKLKMYRKAFDAVDEDKDGYLSGQEALMALKGVVYSGALNDAEEYYVYRILELADYKVTEGADFKLFAVMSALSQRIASLDNFMKDLIRKLDFKSLEYKMFRLKQLFLCNVDPSSNRIPLEHLMLELQAGGVSMEHQREVRAELAHLDNLDLLDFLAYVPLFIMIHQSVVNNPFDNQWNK